MGSSFSAAPLSHVRWEAASGGGGNTSGAIYTAGADMLAVVVASYAVIFNSNLMTDSKGNTYTLRAATTNSDKRVEIWDCLNPTVGSSHTFSFVNTVSGDYTYFNGSAQAWSGSYTAGSCYDTQSVNNSSSGSTLQPGSVTPTYDGSLIITGINSDTGGFSIDSAFSIIDQNLGTPGTSYPEGAAALIQGAKTAVNPTWSGLTSNAVTALTVYRPASYSGGGTAVSLDFSIPEEAGLSARRDTNVTADFGQLCRNTALAPMEFAQSVRTDSAAVLEILTVVAATLSNAVESGSTSRATAQVPDEFGAVARLDGVVGLEAGAIVRVDEPVSDETASTVRCNSTVLFESGQSVTGSRFAPAEFGELAGLTVVVPLEFSGSGTSVTLDIGVPLDWGVAQRGTIVAPSENGALVNALVAILAATSATAALDMPVNLEALASSRAAMASAVEALTNLRRDQILPAECSLRLSADTTVLVEFTGSNITIHLNLEWMAISRPRTRIALSAPRMRTAQSEG